MLVPAKTRYLRDADICLATGWIIKPGHKGSEGVHRGNFSHFMIFRELWVFAKSKRLLDSVDIISHKKTLAHTYD
jgi:hypothetical protein